MRSDYEVGYRKPPKNSRFKKGKSGNPSGRPRRSRLSNSNEILTRMFSTEITIKSGESTMKVSRFEAFHLNVYKRAMEGHGPSMKMLKEMLDSVPSDYKEPNPPIFRENSESDKLIELFRQKAIKYGAMGSVPDTPKPGGRT